MARGVSSAGSQVRIKSELVATMRPNSAATIAIGVHIRQSDEAVCKTVVCCGATSSPLDCKITSIVATSGEAPMTGLVRAELGSMLRIAEFGDVVSTVPLLSSKAALRRDGWNSHNEGRKRDEFGEHVISYAWVVGASSSRLKRCELEHTGETSWTISTLVL